MLCVSRTLEGSPRYRSGSCAICTGPSIVTIIMCCFVENVIAHMNSLSNGRFCYSGQSLRLRLASEGQKCCNKSIFGGVYRKVMKSVGGGGGGGGEHNL